MAEVIVSIILDQLDSILHQQKEKGVRIVLGAGKEIQKLISNFEAIRAVLDDAERRQVVDSAVGDWLNKLNDISCDVDDVVDEWNTSVLKKVKQVEDAFPQAVLDDAERRPMVDSAGRDRLNKLKDNSGDVDDSLDENTQVLKKVKQVEDASPQAVLDDAERRPMADSAGGDRLNKLKDNSGDVDDSLDENTPVLKKVKQVEAGSNKSLVEMLDEWKASTLRKVKKVEDASKSMIKKVCYNIPSCKQVVLGCDIAVKIKNMNKKLDVITRDKAKFEFNSMKGIGGEQKVTTSVIDPSKVHGRDCDKKEILKLLMSESSQGPTLPIISIIGMGGIGKTTLAQLVFIDHEVDTYFHEKIWVSVSYPLDEIRIAKTILESLKDNVINLVELETVLQHIHQSFKGKKFLLVLDDLRIQDPEHWDRRNWEQLMYNLKSGSEGSRILITTREENVAEMMGTTNQIPLSTLSEKDCRSLFSQIAFYERKKEEEETLLKIKEEEKTLLKIKEEEAKLLKIKEEEASSSKTKEEQEKISKDKEEEEHKKLLKIKEEEKTLLKIKEWQEKFLKIKEEEGELEVIGNKIVGKCVGLPLAVKILGGFLRFKRKIEEWENVLNSEIWGLKEVETGLFPAPLLLSYYDLPSTLRKCFSYCAVFPKNYKIEKDRLIKLWMAQSYLREDQQKDLELIGLEYFEYLAKLSFFQDFQRDEYDGSIVRCKMHDMIHDFAQFLTKNEFDGSEKCQHLMTVMERDHNPFPISVYNGKKLRSLVVEHRGGFIVGMDLSKLFDHLTCLRTLDLSNLDSVWCKPIKEVPRGIERLIHLRYLNLSKNTKIKELPEKLCDLYNLQTLELNSCTNLKKLPQGMGKLINLRHLVNNETISLSYIPKGIERLTCLQTLSEFVVSGAGNKGRASTLQCLQNLKKLGGSLKIKMLGNVKDVREVYRAELGNKVNLLDLYLSFKKSEEEGSINEKDEVVLEAIQPHPNLRRLEIFNYGGNIKSNWTMSLTKLKFMSLNHCINLKRLPSLGTLPSLESLVIRSMKSVKRVGDEFLGLESSRSISTDAFPKLKSLEFQKMEKWEEWNYEINSRWQEDCKIMPRLHSLTIGTCRKLKTLPNLLLQTDSLKELKIISCDAIIESYRRNEQGENWPNISHIPNINIYHDGSLVFAQKNSQCILIDPQIDAVKQVQPETSLAE